jgi:hypothetical protein
MSDTSKFFAYAGRPPMKSLLVCLLLLATITLSAEDAKRYEVKTAIIKKEIVAMGMKLAVTTYFDDYGKKEAVEITVKDGITVGVDKHTRTLMTDSTVLNIDLDLKVATKIPLPQKPVNYLALTPEIMEQFKMQEAGESEIAGKPCKKYTLEITQMGQKITITTHVWKGISLKTETVANGTTVATETATEIQEDASVSSEKFVLPEGTVIKSL